MEKILQKFHSLSPIKEETILQDINIYFSFSIKVFSKIEDLGPYGENIFSSDDKMILYHDTGNCSMWMILSRNTSIVHSFPFNITFSSHHEDIGETVFSTQRCPWYGLFTLDGDRIKVDLVKVDYKIPKPYGFTNFQLKEGNSGEYFFEDIFKILESTDNIKKALYPIFTSESINNQTLLYFLSLENYGDLFYDLLCDRVENYTRITLCHENLCYPDVILDMNYVDLIYALIVYKNKPLKIYTYPITGNNHPSHYTICTQGDEYISYEEHFNESYVCFDIKPIKNYTHESCVGTDICLLNPIRPLI